MHRRRFLQMAGLGAASAALPPVIRDALAIPADVRSGDLNDVEHVVILMQENRSFDHYFGRLPGVRGFGDRFTVPQPDGRNIWQQLDARGRIVPPFHLDSRLGNAQAVASTPHTWKDAQAAWNQGRYGEWARHKTPAAMGYYDEAELPFQYALANAFTLCDAYHCSIHGSTNPNRLFLFTGSNDPLATGGGPAIDNHNESLGPSSSGYRWRTYAERLEVAGVSWQIYQDVDDNFDNNPLAGFASFRAVIEGDDERHPLLRKALSTTQPAGSLDRLRDDVLARRLPQVSWLIAPAAYCEHARTSSPMQGAWYVQEVLRALTADADSWSRTALLVMYDENDGFFDHLPPPAPPSLRNDGGLAGASTIDDRHERHPDGQVYGLGPRVPLLVISPWSRGGWVNSQTFDHSSVIRFLERRFGVIETNISPWRRAVCGDLCSAFDFARPNTALPSLFTASNRNEVNALRRAQQQLPPVPIPSADAALPMQRAGTRRSRALPYALQVDTHLDAATSALQLRFDNLGTAGAVLHLYDALDAEQTPHRYTLAAGTSLLANWPLSGDTYDLWLLGPNGFHRRLQGCRTDAGNGGNCQAREQPSQAVLSLQLRNDSAKPLQFQVQAEAYRSDGPWTFNVPARSTLNTAWPTAASGRWYDYSVRIIEQPGFVRRYAGRIENGQPSISDPAMAAA